MCSIHNFLHRDPFCFDSTIGFDPTEPLQYNWHRYCDPTIGDWLSEEAFGCEPDAVNIRPYVNAKLTPES